MNQSFVKLGWSVSRNVICACAAGSFAEVMLRGQLWSATDTTVSCLTTKSDAIPGAYGDGFAYTTLADKDNSFMGWWHLLAIIEFFWLPL